jgi:hypothetical protein
VTQNQIYRWLFAVLCVVALCTALPAWQTAEPTGYSSAPAQGAFAVTPHNTNELAYTTRGIYVGGAGNIVVVMVNGDEVTFTGVTAGSVLPIRVKQIKSTNTTATSILGLR